MWTLHCGHPFGFPIEPGSHASQDGQLRPNGLNRHHSSQTVVVCLIHRPHPAETDLLDDVEMVETTDIIRSGRWRQLNIGRVGQSRAASSRIRIFRRPRYLMHPLNCGLASSAAMYMHVEGIGLLPEAIHRTTIEPNFLCPDRASCGTLHFLVVPAQLNHTLFNFHPHPADGFVNGRTDMPDWLISSAAVSLRMLHFRIASSHARKPVFSHSA